MITRGRLEELEKQLAEEKIKKYKSLYEESELVINHQHKKLLDKDKQIEGLKYQIEILKHKLSEKMETQLLGVTKDKIKEIRHQVCEEIREWCKNDWDWDDFMRFLDQIEKGK